MTLDSMILKKAYYTFKFLVPRRLQIQLRRYYVNRKRSLHADKWPIDHNAAKIPENWSGWPDGKKFALVLTHDVELAQDLNKCYKLAEIEESRGFRSSFNFVPGDYAVPVELRQHLIDHGFEIGIHGLHHSKNPFRSKSIFQKQSIDINRYLKEWGSVGFRSPSMYHDLELLHCLDIEYDASTFDTDPFEPQPDGIGTIFPFWVPDQDLKKGYVELPYTLPQDFLLFILLQEKNIDIWKRKLDWIAYHGGMCLFITHPTYINFDNSTHDKYPVNYYKEFLEYIKSKYEGQYWNALPSHVSRFWKDHYSHEKKVRPEIRVCMLAYSFYDSDARVNKYAEALVRRGDHVDVIALKREGEAQKDHEVLDGVHIYRIQERLLDEKGKLDYLYKLMRFFATSTYHLTKQHLKFPYDIVHVHSVPDFEVFAALMPKISGARIILDIHDPVPDFFAAKFGTSGNNKYIKILTFIEYISAKFADYVITVTDYWKDRIAERSHIENDKISVILNLPDIKIFNRGNYSRITKTKNDFTLLYPGTLNKHCGLDIALKAVNAVKEEIPSIKFLIYGSGRELNNLKQLVNDLGLCSIVYFEKPVSLQFIPKIMAEADVGIALLSGVNEYSRQALNVKLFEFLSMGLPAIATRTKSIEYYLDEETVMLSEPNDPADVARCIRELYYNPGKRNQLIERGLAFIKQNNSEIEMNNYLRIIDKIRNKIVRR